MKVLLVDDDYEEYLLLRGCANNYLDDLDIKYFSKPEKALIDLRNNNYDLVITDLKMDCMTGYDMCREGKKIAPKIPFWIYTGSMALIDVKVAYESGADKLIIKTYNCSQIIDALRYFNE